MYFSLDPYRDNPSPKSHQTILLYNRRHNIQNTPRLPGKYKETIALNIMAAKQSSECEMCILLCISRDVKPNYD